MWDNFGFGGIASIEVPNHSSEAASADPDRACACRKFTFTFVGGPEDVGMATGATIHTANGLKVKVAKRQSAADRVTPAAAEAAVASA